MFTMKLKDILRDIQDEKNNGELKYICQVDDVSPNSAKKLKALDYKLNKVYGSHYDYYEITW